MVSESYERWREAPLRRERIADILRLVAQEPAAHDAREAYDMLEKAFDKVESRMPGVKMYMHPLSEFTESETDGQKIYVDTYDRHLLRIGEYGAIEIRLLGTVDAEEGQPLAITNMKVIFEKSGADGRYLREAPIS